MMALFSQYLANFYAAVPSYKAEKGWHFGRIRVFNLFPVSFKDEHLEDSLKKNLFKGLIHCWNHVDHLLHTDTD